MLSLSDHVGVSAEGAGLKPGRASYELNIVTIEGKIKLHRVSQF